MGNNIDKNILYIVPGHKWNTKERRAFKDMLQAREHGYNVFLMASEDSYIAKAALLENIETFEYKINFFNNFSFFHKFVSLKHVYKKTTIDIVHCYDLSLICSLSYQLNYHPETALVVTQSQAIDKSLKYFWYKPFISRIDSLLLANKNLLDDTSGNLGLNSKKIEYFGVGIRFESAANPLEIAINFELYKNYFLAATYVSPGLLTHEHISPILHALKVVNLKSPGGQKSKLVLISPVDFQTIDFLPRLMKEIQELGLEDDILFVTTQDIIGVISHLDLWISNSPEELIEDYAICSLTHEVPVILARNYCNNDFLSEYEGVGETYKLFDARELRDKWERMIMSKAIYKEKTRVYKFFIEREHSFKNYRAQLMSLYSRSIQRRLQQNQKNKRLSA